MLARKNRISKSEFPSPKTRGIRFLSASFSGVVYPTQPLNTKISVVVSKKTAPKAVHRNRIKRQFYSLFGAYIEKFNKPILIVVYPKKEALFMKQTDLQKEVAKILKEMHLL